MGREKNQRTIRQLVSLYACKLVNVKCVCRPDPEAVIPSLLARPLFKDSFYLIEESVKITQEYFYGMVEEY